MQTQIAGIPCQIRVTAYSPGYPATWHEPAEDPVIEFEVLDRRGYPAPWLEAKLTDEDVSRVLAEYEQANAAMRAESRFQAWLDQRA